MPPYAQNAQPTPEAPSEETRLAWMALALTPGMGPLRIRKAVTRCGDPARLFGCTLTELEIFGMPAASAHFVVDGRARHAAEEEVKRLQESGAHFITQDCPEYPDRLLEIYDPPAVLWLRGDPSLLARPGIAVVGTRSPTPYGNGMAELLSRDLSLRGLTILSGMARGVDTAAHKSTIAAGGKTVAVWGTGIDVIYPKENKGLAEKILATGGTILSEYPLGTFPAAQNFPLRNRILSGMSVGVLVIEGGEYSGTRITARLALEQNRDVYAVPGNVTNKNAWGPNTLIKQGAKLTATWEDVWEDLPSQIRMALEDELGTAAESQLLLPGHEADGESKADSVASVLTEALVPLPKHEQIVLNQLRHDEALQLDDLIEKLESTLGSSEIFVALFELELAGRIKQLPGKNYVRSF